MSECLLQMYWSTVEYSRGRGSECSRPGYGISCLGGGISPLGGGTINPYIEPLEFTQDWGNRLLKDTNKILYAPGPREKGTVTTQETDSDLPVNVQESLAEVCIGDGLLQAWGH